MKILIAGRVIDTAVVPACILMDTEDLKACYYGHQRMEQASGNITRLWAFPPTMTLEQAQERMGLEANHLVMYPEENENGPSQEPGPEKT